MIVINMFIICRNARQAALETTESFPSPRVLRVRDKKKWINYLYKKYIFVILFKKIDLLIDFYYFLS